MATITSTHTTISVTLNGDEVQRVDHPSYADHPSYRAVMATTAKLDYRDGEPWSVELFGRRIRNNGELSKSQGTVRFWVGPDMSVREDRRPPGWVVELSERHRPPVTRPRGEIVACINVLERAAKDLRNGKTFRAMSDVRAEQLKWALVQPSMFDDEDAQ